MSAASTGPAAPRAGTETLGIVLILAAACCFATMDSSIRHAGRLLPVLLILWLRYLTQAVLVGAWLLCRPGESLRSAHPRFQLVRGVLLLGTSAMSFWGVQAMPVAEFTAINMLTPVLVTLFAGWFLHERVDARRWALVVGAFAGALIVMRPGSGVFGWAVLFPLCGALTYASFQVLTSKLAALESPMTTHFYTGLIGTVLLAPVLALHGVSPLALMAEADGATRALVLLIGLLGTGGHLLLLLALGRAPASTLMPFLYGQIGVAALLGWLLFGDLPDGWSWVGMSVIACCGATCAWLNLRPAGVARQ
ncbi:threonine/homoserine efflux transporter RhtA [Sphaerotilus hippei]|uniref:Threonine/homoserine efflux transporter RhtA n=1 Tax=Sphaerotilus hippei TaxID=744406 RepID=A0A318GYA6_9BURK|nr:DMT family transporter [Sphaerotilus hippei]PXW95002.1 threonine/homoserine efflux transporter RhtA [Sphaerotilus hippei]